jgi:hypothetical protein
MHRAHLHTSTRSLLRKNKTHIKQINDTLTFEKQIETPKSFLKHLRKKRELGNSGLIDINDKKKLKIRMVSNGDIGTT